MRIKHYSARPRRRRRNKPNITWYKRIPWKTLMVGLPSAILLFLMLYTWLILPSVGNASELLFTESTIIYDRGALDPTNNPNDHILYTIHGDENREFVPLEEISPWVRKATIAIEDDQFYSWWHWGFDIGGITKGALNYFFGLGTRRGGSTITQQLVKNSFLTSERSITRKFNEILLAVKLEAMYSKDEILELYLNKIPYGNNAHGIEAAAKTFLGKSARNLTLAESVVLASLPAAPTRFSPYGSNKNLLMGHEDCSNTLAESLSVETEADEITPKNNCAYKKGRKDLVLRRLLDTEQITPGEFNIAWSESKRMEFTANRTDIKAPHFVFYVREQVEKKYGKEFLIEGGLRIYTTLDPNLQNIAETAIAEKTLGNSNTWNAKNAALTAIDPKNGEILAYVGGRDFFDVENDGQVDVLTSRRQPGSSFKPLVYATAFEKGYTPSTLLFDVETDFGGNYKPQNYDGEFAGPVTARDSLNRSLNIPAIKMAYLARPNDIFANADKLGVRIEGVPSDHGVALGVGAAEVEPLSHINSFQAFVNADYWYETASILEIHNSNGKILEKSKTEDRKKETINPEALALVRNILTDETTRPTTDDFDWNLLLQIPEIDNGAKTGTSNRNVDNPDFDEELPEEEEENPRKINAPGDSWTIGFSPHLVAGTWVGNNKGEAMKPGATGLTVAAPIWKKFMVDAHEFLAEKNPDFYNATYPEIELKKQKINRYTNRVATDKTRAEWAIDEIFPPYAVPIELDNFSELEPEDQKKEFTAVRADLANWEAPVQAWLDDNKDFFISLGIEEKKEVIDYGEWYRERDQIFAEKKENLPDEEQENIRGGPSFTVQYPLFNEKIPINSIFAASVVPDKPGSIKHIEYAINGRPVAVARNAPFTAFISTHRLQPGKANFVIRAWNQANEKTQVVIPIQWTREKLVANQTPLLGQIKQSTNHVAVRVVFGGKKPMDSIRLVARKNQRVIFEETLRQPPKSTRFLIQKSIRGKITLDLFATQKGEKETKVSTKTMQF